MRKSLVSVIAVVCTAQLCPAMMPVNEPGRHIRSIPPVAGAPVAPPTSQAGTNASGDALLTREALTGQPLPHHRLGSSQWVSPKAGRSVLDAGRSLVPLGHGASRIAFGAPTRPRGSEGKRIAFGAPTRPRYPVC